MISFNTQCNVPTSYFHSALSWQRAVEWNDEKNNAGVSIEESMISVGHNSVSAQRTYIMRNAESESAKFAALGMKKSKK